MTYNTALVSEYYSYFIFKIGGRRCLDPTEEQCIMPMYGSGPFANTSGSGYYTVDNYKEILRYATERHVEVIPEFDMPGHSTAAIKSIHASRQQARRKQTNDVIYSILDTDDKSEYASGQNYKLNAINPCVESTYTFVRKVIASVKEMHRDNQPLAFYHFGGDEVARGAWSKSTACEELAKRVPGMYEVGGTRLVDLLYICSTKHRQSQNLIVSSKS